MKENLDCFVVLENGGKWAMQYLEKNPDYIKDFTSGKTLNIYHYSPPITIGLEFKARQRSGHIINSTTTQFGSLEEETFRKRGDALIIDDEIDTGITLNFTRRFLQQQGYSPREIYVFAKEKFMELKIEPLQHYAKKIKETNKNLWELISITQQPHLTVNKSRSFTSNTPSRTPESNHP